MAQIEQQPVGPKQHRKRFRLLAIVLSGALLLAAAGTALLYALGGSQPRAAVATYFDAATRADVDAMWSAATFERGDAAYDEFFNRAALRAMMAIHQNSSISHFEITDTRQVDASTADVSVSFDINAQAVQTDYLVKSSTGPFGLFPKWKVEVPAEAIDLSVPAQHGQISIDGILVPASAGSLVKVLPGIHEVAMAATPILAPVSVTTSYSDGGPTGNVSASLTPKVSETALALARSAVRQAFQVEPGCSPPSQLCLNHVYSAPNNGEVWFANFPGHPNTQFNYYVVRLVGDPAATMTVQLGAQPMSLSVSGSCTTRTIVNGSESWLHSGKFGADLVEGDSGMQVMAFGHDC